MVLRESLILLLQEKPISRISIKALCEHADINRATFYAHYTDQYDLLKKIQEEFLVDINSYIDSFVLEAGENNLYQIVSKMFEYIAQNIQLCRVLLGKNGDIDFQNKIIQVAGKRIVFEWQQKRRVDEFTANYIFTFAATGSIGVIRKWLLEENPKSPQDMARLVTRLANRGVEAYIG